MYVYDQILRCPLQARHGYRRLPPDLAIEALALDAEAAHAAAVRSIFRTISPPFSLKSFFAAKPRNFYDPSKTLFGVLRRAFLEFDRVKRGLRNRFD